MDVLRTALLGVALVTGSLCAIEWAVRSNRISAFSPIARLAHRLMGPLIKPVERRVLRAGGTPNSAPWWTLIAIVVAGILLLSAIDFVSEQLVSISYALDAGPRGMFRLAVNWLFGLLYIAIAISVIASWLQLNSFRGVVRVARAITEPLLIPIKRILPPFGMIDVSPLVLWVLLSWVLQPLVMRAL